MAGVAHDAQPKARSTKRGRLATLSPMPFLVQGTLDDHTLAQLARSIVSVSNLEGSAARDGLVLDDADAVNH